MNGIKRFIAKLKFLWRLCDYYVNDMNGMVTRYKDLTCTVNELRNEFSSQMAIGYDVHPKDRSWVVLVGHHRNHDYVRAFYLDDKDFGYVVDMAQDMQRRYPKATAYFDHPYGTYIKDWLHRYGD